MGLILAFTQLFYSKLLGSLKLGYTFLTFHNHDFAALQDFFKVFRLSKNNFLDNFSFIVYCENGIFYHFSGKNTFGTVINHLQVNLRKKGQHLLREKRLNFFIFKWHFFHATLMLLLCSQTPKIGPNLG